jgi:hypothetical protein
MPEIADNAFEHRRDLAGGIKSFFECAEQVLLADGLACLFRGPGGKTTPVGGKADECGDALRNLVVALSDPKITDNRIALLRDSIDLFDGRYDHNCTDNTLPYFSLRRARVYCEDCRLTRRLRVVASSIVDSQVVLVSQTSIAYFYGDGNFSLLEIIEDVS